MEKSKLKENTTHGTIAFPYATYTWTGEWFYSVPLHWHPETEIICLEKGEFPLTVNAKRRKVLAPALLFIGAEEVHSIELPKEGRESAVVYDLNMLSFESYDGIQYKIIRPLAEKKIAFPRIIRKDAPVWEEAYGLYSRIFSEAKGEKTLGSCLRVKSGLYALLACLYENGYLHDIGEMSDSDTGRTDTLKRALSYIHENFSGKVTLEAAAGAAGMNPQYFCRYFKKYTGKTITEYVNELRVNEAAKALMESDEKIIDIAGRCGYENMGYFIRRFTRSKGMTPSKYRACSRKKSK